MTSSWFFLSTLNYDARSTTHQIICIQDLMGLWTHMILTGKQTFMSLQKRGFITNKCACKPELSNANGKVFPYQISTKYVKEIWYIWKGPFRATRKLSFKSVLYQYEGQ